MSQNVYDVLQERGFIAQTTHEELRELLGKEKVTFYIGFDENAARISGVPVKTINFIFTLLTALTVSIASRTVGTLIVSSMLVIPIACGMQVGRSYKAVMIIGVITALVTTVIGLTLSYYVGLKPGGTIVLLEVVCFLILALISRYTK